jgi:pyruvate kinase
MGLQGIADALAPLTSAEVVAHDKEYTSILLTPEEYTDVCAAVAQLTLADMLNQQKAVAAFPKLVNAIKLVLAIADHPFQNPTERVKLATKTRKQLESALRIAGELEDSNPPA